MPKLKPETTVERKSHILKAAMVCFADKGYHQTTVDDIVQEAELSKGGLYVHFRSKKDLFLALSDWYTDELGLFSAPAAAGSTAYERLTSMLSSLISTAASDSFRETSSLMTDIWAQNSRDPEIDQVAMRFYTKARHPLVELIQESISDGTLKPVDAAALANILIAIFEGLMIQVLVDETAVEWSAVSETLNSIVSGLLVQEAAEIPSSRVDCSSQQLIQ
ncbi:MAG: TetR/AcrR family transcriptional regulator [Anaerolineae bacterium]|nr:TetR/AcrR family transcriptional regulator [Anaerolineae bacterium]